MNATNLVKFDPRTGLAVVTDPQLSLPFGQLRGLPLVLDMGIRDFSTIPEWGKQCEKMLSNSHYTKYYDELSLECLAVFTRQRFERSQVFTASLFLGKIASGQIRRCVFFVDEPNFRVRLSLRPLRDNAMPYGYNELYNSFKKYQEKRGHYFPLKDTQNVLLQKVGYNLSEKIGMEFSQSADLFVFNEQTIDQIVWDWLIGISETAEASPGSSFRKVAYTFLGPLIDNRSSLRKAVAKLGVAFNKQFKMSPQYIRQERKAMRVLAHGKVLVQS